MAAEQFLTLRDLPLNVPSKNSFFLPYLDSNLQLRKPNKIFNKDEENPRRWTFKKDGVQTRQMELLEWW